MITRLKSNYLDKRGVGIRAFGEMCDMRRTRLKQILSGAESPTMKELVSMNAAMGAIEARHQTVLERKASPAPQPVSRRR